MEHMSPEYIKDRIEKSEAEHIVGLIGGKFPSTYSKSPLMWNTAFSLFGIDAEYIPFDVSEDDVDEVTEILTDLTKVRGYNVTDPHKPRTAQLLDAGSDDFVRAIGGANTVSKHSGMVWVDSTDGYGAEQAVREMYPDTLHDRVVVLGAGGAGAAISVHYFKQGSQVAILNRSWDRLDELSFRIGKYGLDKGRLIRSSFVDSSPFLEDFSLDSEDGGKIDSKYWGMDPLFDQFICNADIVFNAVANGVCIIPERSFYGLPVHMDAVYNADSQFSATAKRLNKKLVPPEKMLLYQAVAAFVSILGEESEDLGLEPEQIASPMRFALDMFDSGKLSLDADYRTIETVLEENRDALSIIPIDDGSSDILGDLI